MHLLMHPFFYAYTRTTNLFHLALIKSQDCPRPKIGTTFKPQVPQSTKVKIIHYSQNVSEFPIAISIVIKIIPINPNIFHIFVV